MAKKKSRKHGDHHARRATRPLHVVPQPPQGPEEQQLFQDLHRVLRAGEPLDLLMFVSSLMAATDPRRKDPFAGSAGDGVTLEDLVDSFVGVDHAETTAALHVVRALVADELLAARIGTVLTGRRQPMPGLAAPPRPSCGDPRGQARSRPRRRRRLLPRRPAAQW